MRKLIGASVDHIGYRARCINLPIKVDCLCNIPIRTKVINSTTSPLSRSSLQLTRNLKDSVKHYSTQKHFGSKLASDDVKNSVPPDIKQSNDSVLTVDLINHLERTSLVEFESEEALNRLSEAINFANVLFEVDTTGVEPMVSVLDHSSLRLRNDVVEEASRDDILKNATITEEDFFVSPPGNIPLIAKVESEMPPILNKSRTKN